MNEIITVFEKNILVNIFNTENYMCARSFVKVLNLTVKYKYLTK